MTSSSRSSLSFAHPTHNVAALGIDPGMIVADFGAGSGAYVHAIAKRLEGTGMVYAIDVQKDLLRRILNDAEKAGLKTVRIIWGDLEKAGSSKLADKSVDLVLISNLLFQLENKDVVLQEAVRILRPRGRCAIIDWDDSYGGMGPQKKDIVTKESALARAKTAGLVIQKEFSAGAHHYGLLFSKYRHE